MLSLAQIRNIDNSIGLQSTKSVFYCREISCVVVIAAIRFDHNKRNRIFFNEDAFCFSAIFGRLLLFFGFVRLIIFDWLFLLASLFVRLLNFHSFFGSGIIFFNQVLVIKFLDHFGNEWVVKALPKLLQLNVKSAVNFAEVVS